MDWRRVAAVLTALVLLVITVPLAARAQTPVATQTRLVLRTPQEVPPSPGTPTVWDVVVTYGADPDPAALGDIELSLTRGGMTAQVVLTLALSPDNPREARASSHEFGWYDHAQTWRATYRPAAESGFAASANTRHFAMTVLLGPGGDVTASQDIRFTMTVEPPSDTERSPDGGAVVFSIPNRPDLLSQTVRVDANQARTRAVRLPVGRHTVRARYTGNSAQRYVGGSPERMIIVQVSAAPPPTTVPAGGGAATTVPPANRPTTATRPTTTIALSPLPNATTTTTPEESLTTVTFGVFATTSTTPGDVAAPASNGGNGGTTAPVAVVVATLGALGALGGVAAFRRWRRGAVDWV